MTIRLALACSLLLAVACEEEAAPAPMANHHPPAVTEQPPEILVNPHVRLRERSASERQREADRLGLTEGSSDRAIARAGAGGGGGGGGGGDIWHPEPVEPLNARDQARFEQELRPEIEDEVEPDAEACRQLTQALEAARVANARTTREPSARLSNAERRQLERACGQQPAGLQRCQDQAYLRAHGAECMRELEASARRGQRQVDAAERQLRAIERGDIAGPRAPSDDEEG